MEKKIKNVETNCTVKLLEANTIIVVIAVILSSPLSLPPPLTSTVKNKKKREMKRQQVSTKKCFQQIGFFQSEEKKIETNSACPDNRCSEDVKKMTAFNFYSLSSFDF